MNKTGFPKTKRPSFSSPYLLFVIFLQTFLLTWVRQTYESTRVNFISTIRTQNKIAESWAKFSRNSFFPEIPPKNLHWIWDKTPQISGQTDEYSPTKKIKQFRTQKNLPFSPDSDELKIDCQSRGTNLGLKSQPKLNRHTDERLVKISDQNTQGVRRSKSQTESEQKWFSKNKTSWLFFPVSSFCDLFTDVPPYLGANNIWKYSCPE